MFTTDSFLNAEVTYRAEKIRRQWGTHRARVLDGRPDDNETPAAR